MGLYGRYCLPRLIHFACGLEVCSRQRAKVVPRARGRVLEIGIGSGLNLPFYDRASVSKVWGVDPSPELLRLAAREASKHAFEVELVQARVEDLALDDHSVDTAVVTYALCTIDDPAAALQRIARLLRPGGELLFCEHGAAPDASVRRWQERLQPVWRRLAGGCHLNRAIPSIIERAGFGMLSLDAAYAPGWRPASFHSWGAAVPRSD